MSEKSEALRLAAIPIFERSITWQSQATIELRRLHAENAELREANETFGRRQVWWNDRMFEVEQQCDALLKEIKDLQEVLVYSLDNQGRYKKKHQKIVDTATKVMEKEK